MTTQSSLQYSFTFTQSHTHSYSASISSTLLFYEAQFGVQHLAQGHFGMQIFFFFFFDFGKTSGWRTTTLPPQPQLPCRLHIFTKTWFIIQLAGIRTTVTFRFEDGLIVKGIVHPKRKVNSLSTHLYADGRVGEGFESTKHFWRLKGINFVRAESNTIEDNGESHVIKQEKKHNMLLWLHPSVRKPPHLNLTEWGHLHQVSA